MKFFRINVSGTKYFLSDKNILRDAPNVFTEKFADELVSSGNRKVNKGYNAVRMAIDRNPETFAYIHRYLQGYDIITHASMKEIHHILEDAKYYKLYNLIYLLENKSRDREFVPLVDYSDSDNSSIDDNENSMDLTSSDYFSLGDYDYVSM